MESLPFLEDIYPHNFLYAAIIRSPIAKGQLKNIETPELPDDFILITAKDIPGKNRLYDTSVPILTEKNLTYIGEPVGLLLGKNKSKLEDIIERCIVNTDEETPVFVFNPADEPYAVRDINIGDTEKAFETNGKIATGSFATGIQEHWYAEPVGAITWYEQQLIVRTATQWPFHVKKSVALTLGIEPSIVQVEPTAVNLHMDGKLWYPSLVACLSALGTFITKSPVRLILNREEDFLYTPKRCSTNIDVASLIDENGNITASVIDICVNLGAHGVNAKEILDQVCLGALGLYDFKNLMLTARAIRTNIPPQGPFCGFGLAQGLFAIERHVSQIAEMTEQDPAVWRKNLIATAKENRMDGSTAASLIDTVTKMGDYYRKWSSYEMLRQNRKGIGENPRGIGIAAGFQGNGLLYYGEDKGIYSVEVTLTKESFLEIKSSLTSPEEYKKIWEKVASLILSIPTEMVHIISDDSTDSGPSCSSRNITAITKLVEKCCMAISKQRFHDPLPITVRETSKPDSGSLFDENWKVMDTSGFAKPGLAAAIVEVSIDHVECIPKIRGLWLAVDGGKIISRHRAKRTLTRAAVQALGWAYTENIEYINGFIPAEQFEKFSIFSAVDTPPIEIQFLSSENDECKGIGELPFTCIPAAFIQAVSQAMDFSYKSIPLRRNDIWQMVRQKNDEKHTMQVHK